MNIRYKMYWLLWFVRKGLGCDIQEAEAHYIVEKEDEFLKRWSLAEILWVLRMGQSGKILVVGEMG